MQKKLRGEVSANCPRVVAVVLLLSFSWLIGSGGLSNVSLVSRKGS